MFQTPIKSVILKFSLADFENPSAIGYFGSESETLGAESTAAFLGNAEDVYVAGSLGIAHYASSAYMGTTSTSDALSKILISSDGTRVFALSSSSSILLAFERDMTSGALTPSWQITPANGMRDIALSENYLYISDFEQEVFKLIVSTHEGNAINALRIEALGTGLQSAQSSVSVNSQNIIWGMQGVVAASAHLTQTNAGELQFGAWAYTSEDMSSGGAVVALKSPVKVLSSYM